VRNATDDIGNGDRREYGYGRAVAWITAAWRSLFADIGRAERPFVAPGGFCGGGRVPPSPSNEACEADRRPPSRSRV
jgi:hypothetical protein